MANEFYFMVITTSEESWANWPSPNNISGPALDRSSTPLQAHTHTHTIHTLTHVTIIIHACERVYVVLNTGTRRSRRRHTAVAAVVGRPVYASPECGARDDRRSGRRRRRRRRGDRRFSGVRGGAAVPAADHPPSLSAHRSVCQILLYARALHRLPCRPTTRSTTAAARRRRRRGDGSRFMCTRAAAAAAACRYS